MKRERVKILLEQAQEYSEQNLFEQSAQYFQKAFDLYPDAFDCKDIYNMGSCYYMIQNDPLAIEFLDMAAECMLNDNMLHYIYGFLGNSHLRQGYFRKALLYFEKSFTLAQDYYEVSSSYSDIGKVYYEIEEYDIAIDNQEKAIEIYLKEISATEREVMDGSVNDGVLGEYYYDLALSYNKKDVNINVDDYLKKAALSGYEFAIEVCRQNGLKY